MTNRGVAGTRVTLLVLRAQVELKASRTGDKGSADRAGDGGSEGE